MGCCKSKNKNESAVLKPEATVTPIHSAKLEPNGLDHCKPQPNQFVTIELLREIKHQIQEQQNVNFEEAYLKCMHPRFQFDMKNEPNISFATFWFRSQTKKDRSTINSQRNSNINQEISVNSSSSAANISHISFDVTRFSFRKSSTKSIILTTVFVSCDISYQFNSMLQILEQFLQSELNALLWLDLLSSTDVHVINGRVVRIGSKLFHNLNLYDTVLIVLPPWPSSKVSDRNILDIFGAAMQQHANVIMAVNNDLFSKFESTILPDSGKSLIDWIDCIQVDNKKLFVDTSNYIEVIEYTARKKIARWIVMELEKVINHIHLTVVSNDVELAECKLKLIITEILIYFAEPNCLDECQQLLESCHESLNNSQVSTKLEVARCLFYLGEVHMLRNNLGKAKSFYQLCYDDCMTHSNQKVNHAVLIIQSKIALIQIYEGKIEAVDEFVLRYTLFTFTQMQESEVNRLYIPTMQSILDGLLSIHRMEDSLRIVEELISKITNCETVLTKNPYIKKLEVIRAEINILHDPFTINTLSVLPCLHQSFELFQSQLQESSTSISHSEILLTANQTIVLITGYLKLYDYHKAYDVSHKAVQMFSDMIGSQHSVLLYLSYLNCRSSHYLGHRHHGIDQTLNILTELTNLYLHPMNSIDSFGQSPDASKLRIFSSDLETNSNNFSNSTPTALFQAYSAFRTSNISAIPIVVNDKLINSIHDLIPIPILDCMIEISWEYLTLGVYMKGLEYIEYCIKKLTYYTNRFPATTDTKEGKSDGFEPAVRCRRIISSFPSDTGSYRRRSGDNPFDLDENTTNFPHFYVKKLLHAAECNALLLLSVGLYSRTEKLIVKYIELADATFGPEYISFIRLLFILSLLYSHKGDYDKALQLQDICNDYQLQHFEANNIISLQYISATGLNHYKSKSFDVAFNLLEKCVNQQRILLGEHHPHTLQSRGRLGLVYFGQGKYIKAHEVLKECYESKCIHLGSKNHPEALSTLNDLALNYYRQEEYTEALSLFRQCLDNQKGVLGVDHPDTLVTMNNLALTLEVLGHKVEAEETLELCIELRRKRLGEDHPDTLSTKNEFFLSTHQTRSASTQFRSMVMI